MQHEVTMVQALVVTSEELFGTGIEPSGDDALDGRLHGWHV